MSDDSFMSVIRAAPNDDAVRLVYADWLEERGDSRSIFLRAEVALAAGTDAVAREELRTQLQVASAGIDPAWIAVVSRTAIENCYVSFPVRCPRRWEVLQPTRDESVRFCASCRKEVFFCATIAVAQTYSAAGECIAVDPRLVRRPADLESNFWDLHDVVLDDEPWLPKDEEPPPRNPRRRKS